MDKSKLVITIERQYGSGGRIIGQKLAEKLGIHFYDDDILKLTSEMSAVGEKYFRLADEKAGNNLLRRIVGGLKNNVSSPTVSGDIVSPDNLFRFQSEVIRKLANEESCVIVGRCADFILEEAGNKNLIRIFVYSDIEASVRRTMSVDGIEDTKEALRKLNAITKQRRTYHRYYTDREWEDVENYDLPINTTRISLDQAVELIMKYIDMVCE